MALQNEEIAQRLRELRHAKGNPPQTAVAEAIHVGERTYQTWEQGVAKPGYRNLQALAEYFGVDESYILTGQSRAETPDPFRLSDQIGDVEQAFRPDVDQLKDDLAGVLTMLEQAAEERRTFALVIEDSLIAAREEREAIAEITAENRAMLKEVRELVEALRGVNVERVADEEPAPRPAPPPPTLPPWPQPAPPPPGPAEAPRPAAQDQRPSLHTSGPTDRRVQDRRRKPA